MINWPVRRRAREVGVERHLLRVGIAPYIQRPIVARTGSQATFCFPRFWISSSSSSSQLLHSIVSFHETSARATCAQLHAAQSARANRGINSNLPKYRDSLKYISVLLLILNESFNQAMSHISQYIG